MLYLDAKQIELVNRNLQYVLSEIEDKRVRKWIVSGAATPIVVAAKRRTKVRKAKWPESTGRYISGVKVATYWRGNLRRSIRVLTLTRAVRIIIGPWMARTVTGNFRTKGKVDGYYAQMIYGSARAFGEKVMQVALKVGEPNALRIVNSRIKRIVPKLAQKYGFR